MISNTNDNLIGKKLAAKIRFSVVIIILAFVFIFSRLWYLQILKGGEYKELSVNNRIRVSKTPAPRGLILSRDEDVLVKNTPSFDLNLIPQDTPEIDRVLETLSTLFFLDLGALKKKVLKKKGRPPFEPITLKKELSWHEMSLILSKKMDLRGVAIDIVPKRLYCLGSFAPHVFGYLGEVSKSELKKQLSDDYSPGDFVGKYGLEKWGESFLKGKKGGLQTEVDVFGNRKKILAEKNPVSGKDIVISINPRLQKKAESLLKNRTGSIVALNPENGDVLALASAPSFDSNLFARGIDNKNWQSLINNPFHPLINKAIKSQQPPGSIFKIITAIAALEDGIISSSQKFFCPGYFKLGRRRFGCWKKGGHGWVDLREALVQSCDCYFYNIAAKIDIDRLAHYSKMFCLGEKTGIALEGEKPGLVPDSTWKKKKYGAPWQKGETLNTSIGQGFLLTTPLQLASLFCGLADGKKILKPRIVLEIKGGKTRKKFLPETLKKIDVSKKTLTFIKEALGAVVNSKKGTGRRAHTREIVVAGKTGTAQVISKKIDSDDENIPLKFKDHAWFVCFAPIDAPKIVLSIFLEHGGSGGKEAAPLARKMIETYFNLKQE